MNNMRTLRLAGLAISIALVFGLVACSSNTTPDSQTSQTVAVETNTTSGDGYDSTVEASFVSSCIGSATGGDPSLTTAATNYCQCAYGWVTENIPFDARSAPAGYTGYTFEQLDDPTTMEAALASINPQIKAACAADVRVFNNR